MTDMMPNIHIQLTAMGRNESSASSMLPSEHHRKTKTMSPHAQPM
jgi:hypothetical protein